MPAEQASSSQFYQGYWPLIAPAWYDIQAIAPGGGSVYVNTSSSRVVITFQNVASYVPPSGPVVGSDLATFQVSLDSDGSIIFAYETLNAANSFVNSNQAIVGVTGGIGATDPGSLNLSNSARTPAYVFTSTGNTVYQTINANPTPDSSDFAGLDLIFTPKVGLTWQVTSDFPGDPAPEPSTLIEITVSAATLLIWRNRAKARLRGSV